MVDSAARDIRWKRFEHPVAFWLGTAASVAGVVLHLPMYFAARSTGYHMAGMRPDPAMTVGMVLIVAGLAAALYGLVPRRAKGIRARVAEVRVRALDDAPVRPAHVAMLLVIAVAIMIDVMKPAALAFVAPGMAEEYGLKSATNPGGHLPVSLLPLFGIGGTVLGSWLWGWLGDRIGRRSSILYAGLLFVTTSICGAMPGFTWNLLMCFLMGVGAGGMLPITFALIAETVPARQRGWLMVLVGGVVASAGYVLTSWLAGVLTPTYSWRVLWLIGLPTGLVLLLLNRWIPESPRFLFAVGRREDAERILRQFGAEVIEAPEPVEAVEHGVRDSIRELFGTRLRGVSAAISVLAVGVGLITFGFQLWIPTNLQALGFTSVHSAFVVRNAALIGLPISLAATALYGFWSSKKTILLFFGLLSVSLVGFTVAGDSLAEHPGLLTALLVVPLSGISLVAAIITVYASEIYPTRIRSRGTGLAAGATKAGGVLVIGMVVAAANTPSIAVTAIIGVLPLVVGMGIFAVAGTETRRRSLDEIGTAEPVMAGEPI